jgi:hypothetical protein
MKKLLALAVLLVPSLASAQLSAITDVNTLSYKIVGIINIISYLLIALAVIFIIWNVVMYIVKGGDPAAKSAAAGNVGWGIVGLAIILSIWGLVNILTNTFRTTPPQSTIPQVQTGTIPQVQ